MRRYDDGGYDDRPRRRKKPDYTLLIVLASVAGIIFVALAGLVVLAVIIPPPKEPPSQTRRLMSRDEFTKAVMGKSPDEIIAAVGRPNETSKVGDSTFWIYRACTSDPLTGKTDYQAQINFWKGRVSDVDFH